MTDTPLPPVSESGDPIPVAPPADTTLAQKLAAEAIGTAILVLIGCGAAVFGFTIANGDNNSNVVSTVTTVALAFGFTIVLLVYSFGRISGGHFNPAVSVGAAVSGRLPWVEAGYYIVAQVVGGIVGAIVLWVIANGFSGFSSTATGLGANHYGGPGGVSWWGAFLTELVLTFLFVFVILSVTDKRNAEFTAFAPLAIGLTLAVIHFVAIPVTGTSVNPARSIGPALFSGSEALKHLWLFIVAPLVGGVLGGLAQPALFGHAEKPVPGSGLTLPKVPRTGSPAWAGQHAGQGHGQQVPSWQQPVAPASEGELPVYEQDGWRWDYASQQWKPIEQHPAPTEAPGGPGEGAPVNEDATRVSRPPAEGVSDETTRIPPTE